jgi:hypothetical protein
MNYNNHSCYSGSLNYAGVPFGNYNLGVYDSGNSYDQPFITEYEERTLDLYVNQGIRFYTLVIVRDKTGNPINLSECSFKGSVDSYYNSGPMDPMTVYAVDAKNGKLALSMSQESTDKLKKSRYVYSVDVISNTIAINVLRGQLMITNR